MAVIGGSEDYTGAPYFSAMASAKLGCDMVRLTDPRVQTSAKLYANQIFPSSGAPFFPGNQK